MALSADTRPSVAELLSDPRANRSWYYEGGQGSYLRIDIEAAWADYRGAGIRVGVVDSQIDYLHTELRDAYDRSSDYNFSQATASPSLGNRRSLDDHGTLVAGVIAAAGGNGVGSVGAAPDATLVGLAIDYSDADVLRQTGHALRTAIQVDVANNSWSFSSNFADNFNSASYSSLADAIKGTAEGGRDGLGTALVFSAGNSGAGGTSNYHNAQNSPYTIAVGAVDQRGEAASFSSIGANVLVSGPGRAVQTTDVNGGLKRVDGTSFSAPIVSSVVALMLEANPALGYRDIQQILALSATTKGLGDGAAHGDGWIVTGTDTVNGGGMQFNDAFGFGLVNARNAVRLAETWVGQRTAENRETVEIRKDVDKTLKAGSTDRISVDIEVTDAILAEHVQLTMDLRWTNSADLDVYLISPDGTSVRMMHDLPAEGSIGSVRNFTLTSVATMGELAKGTWRVEVHNRDPHAKGSDGKPMTGLLDDLRLTIHGQGEGLADDTYFFSDAFSDLVRQDASRASLRETDGGKDAINAAMVTSDSLIDLSGTGASRIDGQTMTIQHGKIEGAYGGDGDDVLIGGAGDSDLSGGRGDDILVAGGDRETIDWFRAAASPPERVVSGDAIDTAETAAFLAGLGDEAAAQARAFENFLVQSARLTADEFAQGQAVLGQATPLMAGDRAAADAVSSPSPASAEEGGLSGDTFDFVDPPDGQDADAGLEAMADAPPPPQADPVDGGAGIDGLDEAGQADMPALAVLDDGGLFV